MTKDAQFLPKDCDTAFRSGSKQLDGTARHNLNREIKSAKAGEHWGSFLLHWPITRDHIINFRDSTDATTASSTMLADELKCFFACFERGTDNIASLQLYSLTLLTQEVKHILTTVNAKKAAGPGGIPSLTSHWHILLYHLPTVSVDEVQPAQRQWGWALTAPQPWPWALEHQKDMYWVSSSTPTHINGHSHQLILWTQCCLWDSSQKAVRLPM